MILEDIILHANIHIWKNPRGEFFLNISRDGGLRAFGCTSPEIKTFIYFCAFCITQANSMSFNGDFIAVVIML